MLLGAVLSAIAGGCGEGSKAGGGGYGGATGSTTSTWSASTESVAPCALTPDLRCEGGSRPVACCPVEANLYDVGRRCRIGRGAIGCYERSGGCVCLNIVSCLTRTLPDGSVQLAVTPCMAFGNLQGWSGCDPTTYETYMYDDEDWPACP